MSDFDLRSAREAGRLPWALFGGYALFVGTVAAAVVEVGAPEAALVLCLFPLPVVGLLYSRRTYLAMLSILLLAGIAFSHSFASDFPLGPGAIVASVIALAVMNEVCSYAVRGRERATAELRWEQERYRLLVETATDAIITIDSESRILFANPAVAKVFGYTAGELLNQPLTVLMPDPLRSAHRTGLKQYLETGKRRLAWSGIELTGLHESGREIPLEISFGEQSIDGTRRFTGIVRDISQRKRYERRLQETARDLERRNDELARANRELEEFSSVASHDLQEPLRKLVSFGALLRDDVGEDLPEAADRDLHFITDAARRMQMLIQDLLALSRTGNAALEREAIAVDECVDRALENLEFRIRDTRARIGRDPLPEVVADRTLLTEIYQNLISNALKFVSSDPPRIRLTCEQHGSGWILGLRDNGIGLRAEDSEQIFRPFRRLHPRGTYEGSGIGLAICRKAVERQGGRIWVESEPGRGSHFRFTLGG